MYHDETLEICCHVDSDLRTIVLTRVLKLQNHKTNHGNFNMSLVFGRIINLMKAVRQFIGFISECRLLYIGFFSSVYW